MKKGLLAKEQGEEAAEFISKFVDVDTAGTHVVKTNIAFPVEAVEGNESTAIVNLNKINDIRGINIFFKLVNSKLAKGGFFVGCVETHVQRKKRLLKKYPVILAHIYFFFDFVFKRVLPKLKLTSWLYFFVTAGRNRVLSKAESLGRLVFCGFNIVEIAEIQGLTYFVGVKTGRPVPEKNPSFGVLFRMKRVGKHGQPITVYKFRTMHPYAEYLQEYVYQQNNLKDGGKFKDDFRITSWGKFMRRCWLDEFPMIINLFKGQVKLVGVRPLSEHYLSLYSEELKKKRLGAKPGLVPPFYADLPVSLQEIMDSEVRYLNAYEARGVRADLSYFFKAFNNIVFRSVRTN